MDIKQKSYLVAAAIIGLAIGLIHQIYIYPFIFHGDAAVYQTLSTAISSEISLSPKDFFYGNQLILLKISPFISLASSLGFTDYKAYAVGGAVAICLWFCICYLISNEFFKCKKTALTLTICLFIPMGIYDIDYMLGQQSHLSNIILCLIVSMSSIIYCKTLKKTHLLYLSISIFLISSESPIRSALVMLPLGVFVFINYKLRSVITVCLLLSLSSLIGFILNKHLLSTHHQLGIDYASTLSLINPNIAIDNFLRIFRRIIVDNASSGFLAEKSVISVSGIIYLIGISYSILLFFTIIFSAKFLLKSVSNKHTKSTNDSEIKSLMSLSFIGILFGLIIISTINPDSGRHIFWAISIAKICVFGCLLNKLSKHVAIRKYAYIITVIMSLSASGWAAIVSANGFKPYNYTVMINNMEPYNIAVRASNETGIKYIYGESIWRMQPINSYHSDLKSSELVSYVDKVAPSKWLSRPSWYCQDGDVLYLTKNGKTDKMIEGILINRGGVVIGSSGVTKVWKGPVIWKKPSWCN